MEIKDSLRAHLEQNPDFLFDGSLCLWALLGYVTIGHDTELQQNMNYILRLKNLLVHYVTCVADHDEL